MPVSEPQQSFHDVASVDEIEEGRVKAVTVGKHNVVLMRHGDTLHALGGRCPHKGAPLGRGAYCKSATYGAVLVCPWHKAVFSAETGAVVEPIAFEALPRYPVEVVQGRVIVGEVPISIPVSPPSLSQGDDAHVVILGGGAAAASAIYTFGVEGFSGKITLIGDEESAPYDRTMLSKSFLLGDPSRTRAPLLLQEGYYRKHNIERLHGRVVSLDHQERRVTLEDGRSIQGSHILVATGGRPRGIDIPGATLDGVMSLHNQADALQIAEKVSPDQTVVLVGGGLIGLEVASSLRQKGVGVIVVMGEPIPMEAQLGREVGIRLLQLHEENSVAFISDAQITEIYGRERVEGVTLDDGTSLPCTHVVVATGVRPQSDFVDGLPQGPEGSLLTNETMCVSPGIYAAGDVSALKSRGHIWRIEHWRHAQAQGRIAARSIMGLTPGKVPVPWFWTQQFGRKIEYLGWGEPFDHVMVEGDLREFNFFATYVLRDRVVALAGSGYASQMARAAVDFEQFVKQEVSNNLV
ncbi:FAD-dependent oxidoreductase [Saccharibacter sp. 17.LH.SD]|uniref:FAD-dependent oxidoreductase n=1 Tax=Saccharibacter sp. 17.LH.SD TaxID=2689393 RepID=UPI00136F74B5|nr:FAD-dependent oxidoreductase [Saccharibacter sp. 17.LH.SD]MXV44034.1 FAD-dependent oxidoreductase [Saccharibacter sp. 17.LH.SD]